MNNEYLIQKYNLDFTPRCCCPNITGPTGGGVVGPTSKNKKWHTLCHKVCLKINK